MQPSRAGTGAILVGLVMTAAPVVAGCGDGVSPADDQRLTSARVGHGHGHAVTVARSAAVLRQWDRRRSAAYAAGDPARLRRLYAPASRAGARDVAILLEYAERGLTVRGLQMQVLEVTPLRSSKGLLRLRVVDRLAGGAAVTGTSSVPLPTSEPTRRVITFVPDHERWVVRSVRISAGRPSAGR